MFDLIRCEELERGIWAVSIGQPPLNLLTQGVRRELGDAFEWLSRSGCVRAVVFESRDNFCAGADLKEFPLRFDPLVARAHCENGHRMIFNLVSMCKPVIAAIDGNCMGGGYELALGCSFRIASTRARIALPEIRRGVWPGTGGIRLLERVAGAPFARRVLLTGEILSAQFACEHGLVDEVVDPEALQGQVLALARQLADRPPSSVQSIIGLLDQDFLAGFRRYLDCEREHFIKTYQMPCAREGSQAFFEKREPDWW